MCPIESNILGVKFLVMHQIGFFCIEESFKRMKLVIIDNMVSIHEGICIN